jgi:tryptophan synthase alpha chain
VSSLSATFAQAKAENRAALITFATVGYPSPAETKHVVRALLDGGSDVVELGIPFSDPLADGATIQHASQTALDQGTTLGMAFDLVRDMRAEGVTTPFVFMGYYNPFLKYGLERVVAKAESIGLNGFIVPDLPPEEGQEFAGLARAHGLDLIPLLAPTSTDSRIEANVNAGSGFVYCVSLTGVTGARDQISDTLPEFLNRVRNRTDLPLAVGFGVSRPEHVSVIAQIAEGVVTASALINVLDDTPAARRYDALADLVRAMRAATIHNS